MEADESFQKREIQESVSFLPFPVAPRLLANDCWGFAKLCYHDERLFNVSIDLVHLDFDLVHFDYDYLDH